MATRLVCTPRRLPEERRAVAASLAADLNPEAGTPGEIVSPALRLIAARKAAQEGASDAVIAVVRRVAWGSKGAILTTGFVDNPPADLRREILRYLNMWSKRANVNFVYSITSPQVRIARLTGPAWGGYWSYLGTEILGIPKDEPTMNLEGFTMRTSQSEFRRVVCHEAGHTLGFPHEHMRRELVQRIDPVKAYAYFQRSDGWSKRDVDQQVLAPLKEATIFATPPEQTSIMCYQLPGEITKDGKPITGGTSITETDHAFAARIYPKPVAVKKTAKKTARKTANGANNAAKGAKKTATNTGRPAKKTAKRTAKKTTAKSARKR